MKKELEKPKHTMSEEDINELMKDWFVRSGDTFTCITAEHKLDWESGDTYSDYFTGGVIDFERLMVKSYDWARETLVAMEIPMKWRLAFLKGHDSYTDGKQIVLSTKVFDDKEYTTGEQVDIFLGLAVHEGAHILYTDFKELRKYKKKIIAQFGNLYEDERIEKEIGEHKPGFCRFLEKTKYHYFDKMFLDMKMPSEITAENVFQVAHNCLLRIIRFPRYLDKEHFEFFGEHLARIKDVLTPYPTSTAEVRVAAELTYNILKEFIEEEFDVPEEEMAAIEEAAAEDIHKTVGEMESEVEDARKAPEPSKKLSKTIADIAEGKMERGEGKAFIEKSATDGEEEYKRALGKVGIYIAAIKKAIALNDKDYALVHKGMRSGVLDEGKLVEALAGVPTVYKRHGYVKTDKIAVCLLIDESGSMGTSTMRAARETAILLNEAIKGNRSIELFCYGHTADRRAHLHTDLIVYAEPGFRPKYALGNASAKVENRDGDAILEAAKRVRKFSKRKCLMFVMSDGAPSASEYRGGEAIRDTRKKVTQVTKMGFEVVQVAINHSFNPAEMFDHYVIFEDMRTLSADLNKYVKKAILKKQHVRFG